MADDLSQEEQKISEYLSAIRKQDNDNCIDSLGLQKTEKGYKFNFFHRPMLFDHQGFVDLSGGELSISIKTVLCKYMLGCPQSVIEKSIRLVTFREFARDSPLFYRFAENTNKTIEQTFSCRLDTLKQKCKQIYGMPVGSTAYDLSVRFKALPRIPITLQFNDTDEMLPAKATVLFHEDAVNYLDLKSLGSITTYLTGLLID